MMRTLIRHGSFQAVQYQLCFVGLRRMQRYLWTHINKPSLYSKYYNQPHIIQGLWTQNDNSFEFSKDLASITDSSFDSDLLLHYSIGSCTHIFLGTIISRKLEKQFLPKNLIEAEVRTFSTGVKRTKQFRKLFMELRSSFTKPTISYEENIATNHVALINKQSSQLQHIALPLSFLQQEHAMGTITPKHTLARHMLVDFMTKAKSGHSIARETSLLMGRMHISSLSKDHLSKLTSIAPNSASEHFLPTQTSSSKLPGAEIASTSVSDMLDPALKSFELTELLNIPIPISRLALIDFT